MKRIPEPVLMALAAIVIVAFINFFVLLMAFSLSCYPTFSSFLDSVLS